MTTPKDIHVESARIQKNIEDHLGINGSLIFDFSSEDNRIRLNLITVNTRHNQSFLFHTEYGVDKIDALRKMQDYVRNYRERDSSYTIQWTSKDEHGSRELQTSYFRARNIYEALDKLYFGREINSITVYSVVMNPLT